MKPFVAVAVLAASLSAGRLAHAEPPRLALAPGVMAGLTGDYASVDAELEATYRLTAEGPLYLRGRLAVGKGGAFAVEAGSDSGVAVEPLVGIEARECSDGGVACALLGGNLGFQVQSDTSSIYGHMGTSIGPTAGGSLGFEVGTAAFKVRAVFDLFERLTVAGGDPTVESAWQLGGDLTLGVACALGGA